MKTFRVLPALAMLLTLSLASEAQNPPAGGGGAAPQSGNEAGRVATQDPKYVYVELDDIFAKAATVKTNNQVTELDARKYGRAVEGQLAAAGNVEPRAASLLVDLQTSSDAKAVVESSAAAPPRRERKLARADILLAAYAVALIKNNAEKDAQNRENEFLVLSFVRRQLLDPKVQSALAEYTDKEIGSAAEPEAKTFQLSVSMQAELSSDKQVRISAAIKSGDKEAMAALNLPPPLCIIFNCCR